MYQKGRAWIELDLSNLQHNVAQLTAALPVGCKLMPAVKANAYGHGLIPIGAALAALGIQDFCVATVWEGVALRRVGIDGQILILSYTHPEDFPLLTGFDLTQTVIDSAYARCLADYGKPIKVHVSIDTGMRRLGERSDNFSSILNIWSYPNLHITGVYSHLCVADSQKSEDVAFTMLQFQRFDAILHKLYANGLGGFSTHIQSSYGFLNYPQFHYDYIRPGIVLYGCYSTLQEHTQLSLSLKPVLSLKSRIETVKALLPGEGAGYGLTHTASQTQVIASVSIGYADGIPRNLSGRGYCLLHDIPVPIIGRICMDQLLLDITQVSDVQPSDEVIFIGSSCDGQTEIKAAKIAALSNTISNEILSRLGERLERFVILPQQTVSSIHLI